MNDCRGALWHIAALQVEGEGFHLAFEELAAAWLSIESIQLRPESRAVVHFVEVGQFMVDYVIDKVYRREHQPKRQVDIAQRGATAPAAFHVLDIYSVVAQAKSGGFLVHYRRQHLLGPSAQGLGQHALGPRLVPRVFQPQTGGHRDDKFLAIAREQTRGLCAALYAQLQQIGIDAEIVGQVDFHRQGRKKKSAAPISAAPVNKKLLFHSDSNGD